MTCPNGPGIRINQNGYNLGIEHAKRLDVVDVFAFALISNIPDPDPAKILK